MSRGLDAAFKLLLAATRVPRMTFLFEFETLGLLLTNWPQDITINGKTYVGTRSSSNRYQVRVEGLGENLKFETPSAVLEITSMNTWAQALFFADSFRGDRCTVTLLYVSGASFFETGWSATYLCDAEEIDADKVKIRLGSVDAALGDELPRRTTSEDGCSWEFEKSDEEGGCTFRWAHGVHPRVLRTCDRTYDGANGCKLHFPDVVDPTTGEFLPRPKPYGAFLGSVDHRLVRAGN